MKKVILLLTAIVVSFILFSIEIKQGHTNNAGAPTGYTGSPNEFGGRTCTQSGCHSDGQATQQVGLITSNIPNTGYIPGQTYTITTTAVDPNASAVRFGFQVSPQSASGALLGTIVVTDASGTKVNTTGEAGKYITHTQNGVGNAVNGVRTWLFDWVAPASGSGTVTFYGAFNVTNNSSSRLGDKIYNSSLTVTEGTTGINEHNNTLAGVAIYPNPGNGNFNLLVNNINGAVETNVFSAEGKLVYTETHQNIGAGKQNIQLNLNGKLNAGVYFMAVKAGNANKVLKFIVQ